MRAAAKHTALLSLIVGILLVFWFNRNNGAIPAGEAQKNVSGAIPENKMLDSTESIAPSKAGAPRLANAKAETSENDWIQDTALGRVQLLYEGKITIQNKSVYVQEVFKREEPPYLITRQGVWRLSAGSSSPEVFVGEQMLVSDQLIVKLKPRADLGRFHSLLNKHDFKIKDQMETIDLYVIKFTVTDFDTINIVQSIVAGFEDVQSVVADIYSPRRQ